MFEEIFGPAWQLPVYGVVFAAVASVVLRLFLLRHDRIVSAEKERLAEFERQNDAAKRHIPAH